MGMAAMSQRARIDWCLSEVKERLKRPDHAGRMWILKPSVTNKGAVSGRALPYALHPTPATSL
eukprot:33820-Eustigmatos_ZCMA.PRE.1